ncbi:MAG: cytochrome b/b6 domain-containing protein [Mariprofundaceae bacterium]
MVRVWDVPLRLFHWLLAASFAVLYLTGVVAGFDPVHAPVGYALLGLLLFRVIWGFAGGAHARFSSFCFPLREIVRHVRGILRGAPPRYLGHSPAGSVYVWLALVILTSCAVTGLITEGYYEFEGPLFALGIDPPRWLAQPCLHAHHLLADGMLALVVGHLAGVLLACVQHRENLVRAMITGRKPLNP